MTKILEELVLLKEIVMESRKENDAIRVPFSRHCQDALKYHEMVIIEKFANVLPCDSVAKLVAFDNVLLDVNLSVSLVLLSRNVLSLSFIYVINKFVNAIYSRMVSRSTSEQLQWKSQERGGDRRQGLSHLVNFLAVIGGTIIQNFGNFQQKTYF